MKSCTIFIARQTIFRTAGRKE